MLPHQGLLLNESCQSRPCRASRHFIYVRETQGPCKVRDATALSVCRTRRAPDRLVPQTFQNVGDAVFPTVTRIKNKRRAERDVSVFDCVSRWRSVIGRFGALSLGSPDSLNPSKTLTVVNSGNTRSIGSSKWSLPCSTSCMAATEVTALVIDAIQNIVSVVIGTRLSTALWPNAP